MARGVVLEAANLPDWINVPLSSLIEVRLNVRCAAINDVNAAALAEYSTGAGQGSSVVVYLTVSTGVAAGIVVNGTVLEGAHHCAGELGNLVPEPAFLGGDHRPNGCLEQTAAGMGLARVWEERTGTAATAEEIFDAAKQGNPTAVWLTQRAADYLAQAAIALGSILDPDCLIVGGSIGMHQPMIRAHMQAAMERALPCPPRIDVPALGHDAPLIGALLVARDAWSSG